MSLPQVRGRRGWVAVIGGFAIVWAAVTPAAASNQLIWEKTYDSGQLVTSAIDITTDPSNGHVYVLARDDCCPLSSYDTIAYSASGTKLWQHASGTAEDLPAGIVVDAATHDVLVTGSRNVDKHVLYTIDYTSTGAVRWSKALAGSGRDISTAGIADDGHGRAIVAGTSSASGVGDYLTVAYRISDGTLLWHTRYAGPFGDDEAIAVVSDPVKGAAYVTGTSQGDNFGELTTVAYSTSSGTQKWVARDTGGNDTPRGLAVDPTNHQVYGLTFTGGGHMAVFAYSASGAALWNTGDDSPTPVGGFPRAIAVDTANDRVYVTGDNETSSTTQTVLASFSAAGSVVWTRVLHHSLNDIPWAVTADPSNHRVYVATERDDSSGNPIFATFAETSAGDSAWSATHGAAGSGAAAPATMTVDPSRSQLYEAGYTTVSGTQVLDTVAYHA